MTDSTFPISYWSGPPQERGRYREVAECGFTVVPGVINSLEEARHDLDFTGFPEHGDSAQAGRHVLNMAHDVGLKAIVIDDRIHRDLPEEADWEETVAAVVADYADHPGLYGYFLTDEPSVRHFTNLAQLTRAFQRRDPEHVPYINLFPMYASPVQLGSLEYRHHVRAYLETVKPPLLSYDHYALMEWGDRQEYFANLEIIREEALRAAVPFWNIILSTPHFDYRDPTAADLRWQVYTTLTYGGKGIAYFTYWTPDNENYRDGIISMYGHRTSKYDVVQQLNLEIKHLGPHLLRLTSTCVSHWPDAPQGAGVNLHASEGLVAAIEGGEYVIGEFVGEDGLPWLMVMNRNRERAAWTTLHLRTQHTQVSEIARSTGQLRNVARDQGINAARRYADGLLLQFWLAPADGRLLRLSSGG